MMQVHKWGWGLRRTSNLATVLPSVKKVVVYGVVDFEYIKEIMVRRLSYDIEEEVMWIKQTVREWLRGEDHGGLKIVLEEEGELKSELDLYI